MHILFIIIYTLELYGLCICYLKLNNIYELLCVWKLFNLSINLLGHIKGSDYNGYKISSKLIMARSIIVIKRISYYLK